MAPVWVSPASVPCTMHEAHCPFEVAHDWQLDPVAPEATHDDTNCWICIEVHEPDIPTTGVYIGTLLLGILEGGEHDEPPSPVWPAPLELPLPEPLLAASSENPPLLLLDERPVPEPLPVPWPVLDSLPHPMKDAAAVAMTRIDVVKSLF
jgi:hypothetical protein